MRMSETKDAGQRSSVRMAAVLTLMQLLTAASAYGVNILSSRTLGAEGRGLLVLALQLTYFAAIFVVLGIERPFMASVSAPFPNAFRAFASFLKPGIWLSGVVVAGGLLILALGDVQVGALIVFGGAYMLLNGLGKGIRVAAVSAQSVSALVWFTVGTQGGMLFLSAVLAALNVQSAILWFAAYTLTGTSSLLILVLFKPTQNLPVMSVESKSIMRQQGLRLLPASISNTAMVRLDRLLLPVFAGISSLGVYSAVSTVMEMASWPIAQWVDSSLGRWRKEGREFSRSQVFRLSVQATLVSLFFSTAVGLVAYWSIVWFLPVEFLASIGLIVPLGISSVIYSVSRVQQGALVVLGRGGTVSVVEIIGMAAAVVGYILLIPQFGALGAALGAIVGYAASVLAGAGALYLRVGESAVRTESRE